MIVTRMRHVQTRLDRLTAHATQVMKGMESTVQISMNVVMRLILATIMRLVGTPKVLSIAHAIMVSRAMDITVLVSISFLY